RVALSRLPTLDAKSSLPQAFPPRRLRTDRGVRPHLLTDIGETPAGQRGQLLRLAGMTFDERAPVVRGGAARCGPFVGMPQHVSPLEVAAIAGLLEPQVLGKVRVVVADVEPREEHVGGAAARVAVAPEDAELTELVAGQRIGGTGIAPA